MEKDIKFLKKYLNSSAPSGYELMIGGQKVWMDYVKNYCHEIEVDDYGNAYATYSNYNKEDLPKNDSERHTVLLDAHADEIGFFVFDITEKGFIKIGRLGGSDLTITPSSRVNIWGNIRIDGVFGHPAIHVHKNKVDLKIESVFIDVGVSSKKEVEDLGIEIGNPITMSDGYMDLGDFHCGRSLDDKIGGYSTAQVLKYLYENNVKLPFDLVVVNSVQEEVGLRGAQMAAKKITPNIAIAIDVTHDTDSPAYNKNKEGSISSGKGIVITSAPSIHNKLYKDIVNVAKTNNIPYQLYASGISTGTNADAYAYPHGIPTALLSIPVRYMHTTVETVHKKDVDHLINYLITFIENYKK